MHEKKPMHQTISVDIHYADSLNPEDLVDIITAMDSPHIVLWYIGTYGPKKEGIDFYRTQIIRKILLRALKPTFHLVDLTAWAALKNPFCSISRTSKLMQFIKKAKHPNIQGISSSDIIEQFASIQLKEVVDHFKKVLKRESLFRLSKEFSPTGIPLSQIIQPQNTMLNFLLDKDTNAVYAPLQYLEGCFLVSEIARKYIQKGENIQIVFALPNKEAEYYKDDQNSFAEDIRFLMSNQCKPTGKAQVTIDIHFLSFKYGGLLKARPYNASGSVLSKEEFSLAKLIGLGENLHEGHSNI